MKRVLILVLAILFTLSLAACGDPPSDDLQTPADVSIGESNKEESETPGETPIEVPNDVPVQEEPQEAEQPQVQEATITETVLVDEAGVKLTAKSLNLDGLFGPELQLLVENNSGQDLIFQSRNASVNGYMVETLMSVDVVDGKKANDTLIFSESSLETCGIGTIADMEFSFHIFTSEGWDNYLDTPQIQLKTSAADTYEYTFDDSGDVAYDENGVKIVVKGISKDDSIFGPGIVVYMENNRDQNITIQTRDVSINDFMVDALFSSDIMVGKHAMDAITFMSSDLEENGITDIKTVELSFHIFDDATWDTIVDTDVVTISF